MKKQIEINVDEAKLHEAFKKSFRRFTEKMKKDEAKEIPFLSEADLKDREHTPAEKKFLNRLTVGVCAIAVLIMFAAYHLFPVIK